MEGQMVRTDLCLDNDASRAELTEIAIRLDAASAAYSVGLNWTVATSFCHLAFWDRRAFSTEALAGERKHRRSLA
jgi:hypothetical protein